MEHKKYLQDNVLLTKEAFEQYARKLREDRAKEFGMTLEQWDAAIANGDVVQTPNSNTPPNNNPV
jgi:hypothetical protein